MVMGYTQHACNSSKSTTTYTYLPSNWESNASVPESIYPIAFAQTLPDFLVEKALLIKNPHVARTAKVLRSFYINVQPVQGEFVASSDISDVYEVGKVDRQAILNYLYSLVDEVIWLQEREENLSKVMLEKLRKLQMYLRLV